MTAIIGVLSLQTFATPPGTVPFGFFRAPPPFAVSAAVQIFAGQEGGLGNADGAGSSARFNYPLGVAMDSSGNIFVADQFNNSIRKVTSVGVVTTLAGGVAGSADGTGAAAKFNNPEGVAVDSSGNVFVADFNNNSIRKVTSAGVVTTLAGGASGASDGTGTAAQFSGPSGVVVDAGGNVYVADQFNNSIRKVTSAGVVTTIAGDAAGSSGTADGTGSSAQFNAPTGITIGAGGNLFVTDGNNNSIRKVTPSGVVTTLAGGTRGSADGTGSAAQFYYPYMLSADSAGNLFVADRSNNRIRKVTPAGVVTTLVGGTAGFADGTSATAQFAQPSGVATNPAGTVLVVSDNSNQSLRQISSAGDTTTLTGLRSRAGYVNGQRSGAQFNLTFGLAADASGNIFVADFQNNAIRKVTAAGKVTTLAGGTSGSADGTGTAATFSNPYALAIDSSGNVFVADQSNNLIRKVTPAGVTTTISFGFIDSPTGITVDAGGTLYVSDSGNGRIQKRTSGGTVSTFANVSGSPAGLAVDGSNNVYMADVSSCTIRKFTPAGASATLAGGTCGSADGTGTAARFNAPRNISLDASGNLYVADGGNHLIRKVTSAGVVTTVVGVSGRGGLKTGPLPAGLNSPVGVAVSGATLYVSSENAIVALTKP